MFPLADLVSPESDLLLDTLNFESDWLLKPVVTWSKNDDYKRAVEYARNVRVVNDISGRVVNDIKGRAVKMMTILVNVIATDFQQIIFLL